MRAIIRANRLQINVEPQIEVLLLNSGNRSHPGAVIYNPDVPGIDHK